MRTGLLSLILLSTTCLGLFGCKTKPGDSCQKGTATCLDEKNQLSCQSGKFISTPCKGPQGCTVKNNAVECDVSGNAEGDVCSTDDEDQGSCTTGNSAMIACHLGKWEIMACRGPDACKAKATGGASCDNSIAQTGDRCVEGGNACSLDKKDMLTCKDGRYAIEWHCRGPDGCTDTGQEQLACDTSIADVGDTCFSEGNACSLDKKRLLACKDGHFILDSECRGLKACAITGDDVTCDQSLAEVGDDCDKDDAACRVDGKALLACKEGKLVLDKACNCVVEHAGKSITLGCK